MKQRMFFGLDVHKQSISVGYTEDVITSVAPPRVPAPALRPCWPEICNLMASNVLAKRMTPEDLRGNLVIIAD